VGVPRQNFLGDEPWDEIHEELAVRSRVFHRTPDQLLTGSLHELAPGSPGFRLHMHYGAEELFFVVSGRPTLRTGAAEEQLGPGDVVHCPDGRDGLHTFTNPTDEPVRLLAISAGGFPDVVAYPEHGVAWVATRNPDFDAPGADPGIIARFDLPPED
jgi:mannose-6-phosphate isomerase-like protein (cupin superfamily)